MAVLLISAPSLRPPTHAPTHRPTLPSKQVMTQQALIGTCIAIFGTWLYTDQTAKAKHAKPKAA